MDEINQRQAFDLRSWHEHGEKALQEAHVRTTLEQLHASVRERLDRAERALRSPNNLIKHNSAFVGRVHELTELRNARRAKQARRRRRPAGQSHRPGGGAGPRRNG